MAFSALTKHEQHVAVFNHFVATETDVYIHGLNAQRYEAMLASGKLSPKFSERIRGLLNETHERLAEVTAIRDATLPQLPSPDVMKVLQMARVAEMTMHSGAPAERAAAFAVCDPELASMIMSVSHLAAATKKIG